MNRAHALRHAAAALDEAEVDEARSTVRGRSRGLPTTFRFVTREAGEGSERWTEVEVGAPVTTIPEMEVRPETGFETALVAEGRAVDVELDDPGFDPLFVVEAAPADAVRRVLDAPTRALLVALYPCTLQYSGTRLQLAKQGWPEQSETILGMLELAAAIAAGIGPACAAFEEARVAAAIRESSTSTYRGADPEAMSMEADFADPRWEVASLHRIREERRRGDARRVRIGLVVWVSLLGAMALVAWLVTHC